MLEIKDCCLVVVDIQGKLAQLMCDKEELFKNAEVLVRSAKILDIPILWCQQCPDSLGATIPQIADLLTDNTPINKSCFSCCGCGQFADRLNSADRKQILLCGIETHVCIYQTAVDLIEKGKEVTVIADAVSSRTQGNKQIGLRKMLSAGTDISSAETALFELLKTSDHPSFKQIVKLIK